MNGISKHLSHSLDFQLETDASHYGWEAKLRDLEGKGDWNRRVSSRSSNYRERLAILLTLTVFKTVLQGRYVQFLIDSVSTDSVSTSAYTNHKGDPVPAYLSSQ